MMNKDAKMGSKCKYKYTYHEDQVMQKNMFHTCTLNMYLNMEHMHSQQSQYIVLLSVLR